MSDKGGSTVWVGASRGLCDLMARHGVPRCIRSDKGPEMIAKRLRQGLKRLGSETIYITPGRPWENGYCESFNGKLWDE